MKVINPTELYILIREEFESIGFVPLGRFSWARKTDEQTVGVISIRIMRKSFLVIECGLVNLKLDQLYRELEKTAPRQFDQDWSSSSVLIEFLNKHRYEGNDYSDNLNSVVLFPRLFWAIGLNLFNAYMKKDILKVSEYESYSEIFNEIKICTNEFALPFFSSHQSIKSILETALKEFNSDSSDPKALVIPLIYYLLNDRVAAKEWALRLKKTAQGQELKVLNSLSRKVASEELGSKDI